jgi:hypothetical protein
MSVLGDAFPSRGERNIIAQALRHVFLFFLTLLGLSQFCEAWYFIHMQDPTLVRAASTPHLRAVITVQAHKDHLTCLRCQLYLNPK